MSTLIQIVTIECKDKIYRFMLEEIGNKRYVYYESCKEKKDDFFSNFNLIDKYFETPELALKNIYELFIKNKEIIIVDNQISKLLTTDAIKNIIKTPNIRES